MSFRDSRSSAVMDGGRRALGANSTEPLHSESVCSAVRPRRLPLTLFLQWSPLRDRACRLVSPAVQAPRCSDMSLPSTSAKRRRELPAVARVPSISAAAPSNRAAATEGAAASAPHPSSSSKSESRTQQSSVSISKVRSCTLPAARRASQEQAVRSISSELQCLPWQSASMVTRVSRAGARLTACHCLHTLLRRSLRCSSKGA